MQFFQTPPAGYVPVVLTQGPYSASKLQIASCPARFESKYIRKSVIVADTLASARGSAVHYIFERITQMKCKGEVPNREQITKWTSEALAEFPAAYQQIDLINAAVNAYLGNFSPYANHTTRCEIEVALKLYEEETFLDNVTPGRAYTFTSYDDKGAFIRAKLDHIAVDHILKQVTVVDHKTTPSASQGADMLFQMSVYALLAHFAYPGYKVRTVIHFAHPDLNFYSPPMEWGYEDLLEAENSIMARVRAAESFKEFPAIPGNYCDYCHMSTDCPMLRAVMAQNNAQHYNKNVTSIDDVQKLAEKVRVLGVAYDELNKAMKQGMDTLNLRSIAINGMRFEFRVSEGVNWDATEKEIANKAELAMTVAEQERTQEQKVLLEAKNLKGILAHFGLNPEGFRDWDNNKLKAIWKLNRGDLIAFLKQFVVVEKKTKFSGYKS